MYHTLATVPLLYAYFIFVCCALPVTLGSVIDRVPFFEASGEFA